MEDGLIGKHCDICMSKDYLNFHCAICKKNLCKEHYHNEVNCKEYIEKKTDILNTIKTNVKCALCKVEIFNRNEVICNLCSEVFCYKHRLYEDHKCTKWEKKGMQTKHTENKDKFKEKLEALKKNSKK
jgi:hypothetical protein